LRQEKWRGPYPSLTPALIKDQNKVLRYTPQSQRRYRAKSAKTTRRLTTLAKALSSKARRRKIGTAAKLQGKTSRFKISIMAKDRRP